MDTEKSDSEEFVANVIMEESKELIKSSQDTQNEKSNNLGPNQMQKGTTMKMATMLDTGIFVSNFVPNSNYGIFRDNKMQAIAFFIPRNSK